MTHHYVFDTCYISYHATHHIFHENYETVCTETSDKFLLTDFTFAQIFVHHYDQIRF